MASGVPYLKDTRTKFLNTLKSEIKYGSEMLLCDRENIDSEEFILKTNKCIDKIQNYDIMRQSRCLVFNPITVNNFASLFNCTPVGRASDSMMAPT